MFLFLIRPAQTAAFFFNSPKSIRKTYWLWFLLPYIDRNINTLRLRASIWQVKN